MVGLVAGVSGIMARSMAGETADDTAFARRFFRNQTDRKLSHVKDGTGLDSSGFVFIQLMSMREASVRVLLVEDDPLISEFLVESLRDHGFDVIHANGGEEALAWCRRRISDHRYQAAWKC